MLLLRELGGRGENGWWREVCLICPDASWLLYDGFMTTLCSGTLGGSYLFLGRSPSRLCHGY